MALQHGWRAGARYTNLRDTRHLSGTDFIDIDWKNYDYRRHLEAVQACRPKLTVAQDILCKRDQKAIIDQAYQLLEYSQMVAIVPKDLAYATVLEREIPRDFIFGYSVPTRYGGTEIPVGSFRRPVHLLGGRPDVQRRLADVLRVVSLDCNRFTLDAGFGDYFDGRTFRPHPTGGYETCVSDSLKNINALWLGYQHKPMTAARKPRLV